MSEQMYNDGYHNIINTDYSPVVIENIKNKCQYIYMPRYDVESNGHSEHDL